MPKDLMFASEYEQNGEKKTKWLKCGVLIEKGDKTYVELEQIPVGASNASGGIWLQAFEQRSRDDRTT